MPASRRRSSSGLEFVILGRQDHRGALHSHRAGDRGHHQIRRDGRGRRSRPASPAARAATGNPARRSRPTSAGTAKPSAPGRRAEHLIRHRQGECLARGVVHHARHLRALALLGGFFDPLAGAQQLAGQSPPLRCEQRVIGRRLFQSHEPLSEGCRIHCFIITLVLTDPAANRMADGTKFRFSYMTANRVFRSSRLAAVLRALVRASARRGVLFERPASGVIRRPIRRLRRASGCVIRGSCWGNAPRIFFRRIWRRPTARRISTC
jgi:hypothetical protein